MKKRNLEKTATADNQTRRVFGFGSVLLAGTALALAMSLATAGTSFGAPKGPFEPEIPPEAKRVDHSADVFKADPSYEDKPYDPQAQYIIYGDKKPAANPRPLIEIGRKVYTEGPFEPGINLIGERNLLFPGLNVFGDVKTAVEFNDNGNNEVGQVAFDVNLNIDFKLTGTERIFAFVRPVRRNGNATRYEFFGDDSQDEFESQLNGNIETLFFEGDLGQIASGINNADAGFDLPFTFGLVPLLFQNGVWMEEAIVGGAFSIPAINNPALAISNMDITFFGGFDSVENPGIRNPDGDREQHDLSVMGVATFIEATEGYYEAGYGHIKGSEENEDQSFHSLTAAYSKRYGGWLSNSVRGVWAFGQKRLNNAPQTADGFALLVENSLITSLPSTLVPYANFFVGVDRPQPLADETGLLKNTGITFENPGITNFPKLDDTANDAYGGAIGIQYLFNLDQQIVVEAATSQAIGGFKANGRATKDDQYALGFRYQLPISPAWIVRADGIYGSLKNDEDIRGARLELRRKF